ncbi:patatin-like phospholipase family protein [Gimesia chilikensis]|uniref:CBASS cGAMP-activated phospholipase n=1 Tax=Gimesia chilikensis TaxID=2605989 RepID=UPI0011EFD532|nr:CBASS cGAMP-activated phospholipase [Gimesia chilikensis]KAA0139161.1 patatin-like phospholipase family protein [Gimesia chilikensis]
MDEQRFQILSLDGGGIKGLFSAAVLAAIEEDLEINVVDRFDLITGTSTGGIIALGLGIGMRPREIVEFYISKGPAIFNKMWGLRWWQHWIRRKYSQTPLRNALESCFNDKLLGDCTKRIVIPSFSVGDDDVYLFRTPHDKRLRRDKKVPLWKIALATSAAPTFFPSCRHVDRLRLIDGGVWANNPSMVGVVEAYGTLGVPLNAIKVFSIGTTDALASRKKRLDWGGKLPWVTGNDAVDIIMRGQSIGVNNQTKFLLGQNNVIRWDPKVAASDFSLDSVGKVDALIAKAAHYSRIHIPKFEEVFADHIAEEFIPIKS